MLSPKLKQMRKKVREELEHIPKGALPQNELRAMYWMQRMHSLGRKAINSQTPKQVLEECIAYLGKEHSDFEFKYNEKFFESK